MQSEPKAVAVRRIDLSKCKLLSTYGHDVADPTKPAGVKVGQVVKVGVLTKVGH